MKGNLKKNKLIVDRLQLPTQWSPRQRWEQRIKALSLGTGQKLLAAASISNVSSSSFQLALCNNHTYETLHVHCTNQLIVWAPFLSGSGRSGSPWLCNNRAAGAISAIQSHTNTGRATAAFWVILSKRMCGSEQEKKDL